MISDRLRIELIGVSEREGHLVLVGRGTLDGCPELGPAKAVDELYVSHVNSINRQSWYVIGERRLPQTRQGRGIVVTRIRSRGVEESRANRDLQRNDDGIDL